MFPRALRPAPARSAPPLFQLKSDQKPPLPALRVPLPEEPFDEPPVLPPPPPYVLTPVRPPVPGPPLEPLGIVEEDALPPGVLP